MKATPMITLPLKGMEDADWSGPLKNYFASVYGTNEVFTDEINSLNKLRQDVRGAAKDNIGRDILYKYYAQLELLALRIPVSEHDCRINFTWHDSFTHASNSQHSLAFEKASLLYNLACINAHIGAEADDLKISYNRFKDAAGIFSFIISNFLHAPSTDLSQETVKALSKLMLAQAQEAFVERLLSEGASSAMIPKLAKGASTLYKSAADSLQVVFTEKNWGEKSWHLYCSVKAKYYSSVAHEQTSKSLETSGKYGEAIAHLQAASSNSCDIYKSSIPTQYAVFYDVVSTFQESLKEKISSLEKENDLIYHNIIPSAASIADIPTLEAATPTPINELYKESQELSKLIGKELFEKVIPLSVHQQTSLYSEEKAAMLRSEGEKIEIANEELSSALEFLDLPSALHNIRSESSDILSLGKSKGVDSQVNDWASQVAAEAQHSTNSSSFSNLDAIKRTIYENVKKAEVLLKDEGKAYELLKSEFGHDWKQAPSETMNSGLMSDISRIKHDLANASNSDEKLKAIIGEREADIQILKLGPNNPQLRAFFDGVVVAPQASKGVSLLDIDQSSSDSYVDSLLNQVEELIGHLSQLKQERSSNFTDFKERVHKDDISGILILNNKNPDIQESLFKSELSKFKPFQTQLEDSIQYQKNLLKELTMTWKKVLEDPSVQSKLSVKDSLKSGRSSLVSRFQKAFDSWKDSQEGLNKASNFYEKLLDFTKSTLSNSEEFVANRQDEAKRLKAENQTSQGQNNNDALRDQLAMLSVSSQSGSQSYYTAHNRQAQGASLVSNIPSNVSTPSAPAAWGDLSIFDNKSSVPPPKPPPPTQTYTQPQYTSNFAVPHTPQQQNPPPPQPQYFHSPSISSQQVHRPLYENYASSGSQPYAPSTPSHYQSEPSYEQHQQPPSGGLGSYSSQPSNPQHSSYSQPIAHSAYPSYSTYQAPQAQAPQYGGYQAPPAQHSQSQQPPPHGFGSYPQPSTYGGPPAKDYSRMPPPPPPPGAQSQGQGYYR